MSNAQFQRSWESGDDLLDQALETASWGQKFLRGIGSAIFIAVWPGILYAQLMVSSHPAMYAGHCSLSFSWNTVTTENANMAAVAIVMAGISGYLLCNPRKTWGKSALIGSLTVCSAFTILVAVWAFLLVLILLDGPDRWATAPSAPLTGIAQALTVIPGLAAVSTLIVCWMLRRSNVNRLAAALAASLLPALWYMLAIGMFLAATAVFCPELPNAQQQ